MNVVNRQHAKNTRRRILIFIFCLKNMKLRLRKIFKLPNEKLAHDVFHNILYPHFVKITEVRDGNKPQVRFSQRLTNHTGDPSSCTAAFTKNVSYVTWVKHISGWYFVKFHAGASLFSFNKGLHLNKRIYLIILHWSIAKIPSR